MGEGGTDNTSQSGHPDCDTRGGNGMGKNERTESTISAVFDQDAEDKLYVENTAKPIRRPIRPATLLSHVLDYITRHNNSTDSLDDDFVKLSADSELIRCLGQSVIAEAISRSMSTSE